MIATNESILVQTLLNEGVSIKTIKKIYRIFKGWRIYREAGYKDSKRNL